MYPSSSPRGYSGQVAGSSVCAGSQNVSSALSGHNLHYRCDAQLESVAKDNSMSRPGKHLYPNIANCTNFRNGVILDSGPTYVYASQLSDKPHDAGEATKTSRRSNYRNHSSQVCKTNTLHRPMSRTNIESMGQLLGMVSAVDQKSYSNNPRFTCRPENRPNDNRPPRGPVRSVELGYTDRLL